MADLSQAGPDDTVAQIDFDAESLTFGNGINGRVPPLGAQILVTYETCDGAAANTARGQAWTVQSLNELVARNLDAVGGGGPAQIDSDRRRDARRLARQPFALVTSADIEAAALALPDLEVGRAETWVPDNEHALRDVTTLLAMRERTDPVESSTAPETARWLQAVALSLNSRLPLGRRLHVIAPQYVDFALSATLQSAAGADPAAVQRDVTGALTQRLRLTASPGRGDCRKFGVPVSSADVSAWLRGVGGVARVLKVELKDAAGKVVEQVEVPPRGLPRFNLAASSVTVQRAAQARP